MAFGTLQVLAEAPTEIIDFVVPSSLQQGSDVNVRVLLRNVGTGPGHLFVTIDGNPTSPDRYIAVENGTTYPIKPESGDSMWLDIYFRYFKMPAWDFILTASNSEGTSSIIRTIVLAVAGTPTTLDMTAPDRVAAGESFDVYGTLIETDTGTIIPGQRINLRYDGKSLGFTYTGSEGDYYFTVSIPEGGVFTIKAEFPGTPGYAASASATSTSVTLTPEAVAIQIGVPFALGALLRYLGAGII